ncbi:MAG: hypothetical protein ACI965_000677 [Paraglaciecola sp.]|jgi:hypothetical protein
MKLAFLCANHRQWLSSQPDQAFHCCANSFETGWRLYQHGRLEEALPYVGCAFESAEILLTTQAIKPADALEWFLHTLAGLIQTLKKLDRFDTCRQVYQGAIDRLQKESRRDAMLKPPITLQLNRLERELRQLSCSSRVHAGLNDHAAPQHWSAAVH